MMDRTITLRADLVEHLEALAERQDLSLDGVFGQLLDTYAPTASNKHWALAVAGSVEAANINWIDDPDASVNSWRHLKRSLCVVNPPDDQSSGS